MSGSQMPVFGGDWTEQKLEMLRKYLHAYTTALKKQPFELLYIDALAGTGYRYQDTEAGALFPYLAEQESQRFFDGSARIALEIEPPFDRYVLIESSTKRFRKLIGLKQKYPMLSDRIELVNEDCNAYLQRTCIGSDWSGRRRCYS